MMTKEQQEARIIADRKAAFARWKDEPMVRMVLSQLPPNESLEMVLRAAYEAGWNSGSANAAVSLAELIMFPPKERR